MRVCVCACVRACVRVCVCACVRVCVCVREGEMEGNDDAAPPPKQAEVEGQAETASRQDEGEKLQDHNSSGYNGNDSNSDGGDHGRGHDGGDGDDNGDDGDGDGDDDDDDDALFESALSAYDEVVVQTSRDSSTGASKGTQADAAKAKTHNRGSSRTSRTSRSGGSELLSGAEGDFLGDALADDFLRSLGEFETDPKAQEMMKHLLGALAQEDGDEEEEAEGEQAGTTKARQDRVADGARPAQTAQTTSTETAAGAQQQQQQPSQAPQSSSASSSAAGGKGASTSEEAEHLSQGFSEMLQRMASMANEVGAVDERMRESVWGG